MQFISFIASTMLIVLISQHSTMGLPLNNTVVDTSCLEGFEMMNGQCMPINDKLNGTEIESVSLPSKDIVVYEEEPVTHINTPIRDGACPEGWEHGEHGICQEIKLVDTTEVTVELTTYLDKNLGNDENLGRCPEGTEHDDQGACQEIKPSTPTKLITDPKVLLKPDGSCPENYKMVEGRCLYVKPTTNSTLYSSELKTGDNVPNGMRPKSGTDKTAKVELVPVLSDNSCPEGTEYSEYGLCQKRIDSSSSKLVMKADGSCPDGFELINGKCSYKNSKIQGQTGFTTTIRTVESTTFDPKSIINDEVAKPSKNNKLPKLDNSNF